MEAETRYHPTADQLALAGTIDESLTALLPLSRLHTSHGEDGKTWSGLDEIGIFGITTSEEQGGSGLGAVEEALIVLSLGRHLAAPSVFATIGAAHGRPEGDRPAAELRGRRVAAAYRRGDRTIIIEDTEADLVLLREPGVPNAAHVSSSATSLPSGALHLDAAGLYELGSNVSRKPLDDRLWLAGLREAGLGAGVEFGSGARLARFDADQLLRLRLIDAAALAGISQAALDMAVGYAGIRTQFGRPIGSFQAVKHHCANMAIAARCARDQTNFAAVALNEGRADAALQVECALSVAGWAALENSGKNIQIHGGIGFSDEADPHLCLKRAQLLIAIAGGLEAASMRIAGMKGVD